MADYPVILSRTQRRVVDKHPLRQDPIWHRAILRKLLLNLLRRVRIASNDGDQPSVVVAQRHLERMVPVWLGDRKHKRSQARGLIAEVSSLYDLKHNSLLVVAMCVINPGAR